MRRPALRTKLTLWYSLTILALLAVFFVILTLGLSPALTMRTERTLTDSAQEIAGEVELEKGYLELDDDVSVSPRIWYTVYDLDGSVALSNHPASWVDEGDFQEGPAYSVTHDGLRWMFYDSYVADEGQLIGWLRVAMQVDSYDEAASELLLLALTLLPVLGGLSLLVGWVIARRALRPVERITNAAREASRGDLSGRLGFPESGDEVGRLAATFDEMLAALQAAFEREKRFTSDASHELRTPLSVIMAHAQQVLDHPDATKEEYRESVETIYRKSRDMQAMLSQMLLLSRGYEQKDAMERVELDLGQLAQDIAEEMAHAAGERGISIETQLPEGILVHGDLLLLTRMVMNLVDNAVKYGKDDGWVRLTLCRDGDKALLTVEDNGVGIAPDQLPHIFRRFYRSDEARSGGGVGLGLSLVEWIAGLHGGGVTVESSPGVGTKFVVTLPI